MTQPSIKFQSSNRESTGGFTSFGGLLLLNNLYEKLQLDQAIDANIGARSRNTAVTYKDSVYIKSLVMMQTIGGETVDDLHLVRSDPVMREMIGPIPGRTSFHKYLSSFVDKREEALRGQGNSFVPRKTACLEGFNQVTKHLLERVPHFLGIESVTLDQDATYIPTGVSGSLYNYKSERSFQAFNTYCPEYDMMITSEFRDGNVTPGHRQLENFVEALELLPDSVRKVRLRSDTAGYQTDLIKYCAKGCHERFGVIDFAIGAPVTQALKESVRRTEEFDWRPVSSDSKQQCAEIALAPNSLSFSKNGPDCRFVAIREELKLEEAKAEEQQTLLFDDENLSDSPLRSLHPTLLNGKVYKVFSIVTNLTWPAHKIVSWYRGRCGKSEEIHRILKDELAGGHVVTSALGANAAWWQIAVLTANILNLMKRICLPASYRSARPKRLRFHLFSLVARLSSHARKRMVVFYRSYASRLFCVAWSILSGLRCRLE